MTEDKDLFRPLTQRLEESFAAADAALSGLFDDLVQGINERGTNAER